MPTAARAGLFRGLMVAFALGAGSAAGAQETSPSALVSVSLGAPVPNLCALATATPPCTINEPTVKDGFGPELLPARRLWRPPLANQWQPRMYVKPTTLDNQFTEQTIDTALGATIGLFRCYPTGCPDVAVQLDGFAVHFARWSNLQDAVGGDYRYGLPLTFALGPWHAKISYEHTSTHLGDDYIRMFGRLRVPYIRDEVVFGLDHVWWEQLRLYGEVAYAFDINVPNEQGRERFDWGLEWCPQGPTGWRGRPFAAFDMDLRPELDYKPNVTLQLGWQWVPETEYLRARLGVEFYDGRSTFGQFIGMKERWVGLFLAGDF